MKKLLISITCHDFISSRLVVPLRKARNNRARLYLQKKEADCESVQEMEVYGSVYQFSCISKRNVPGSCPTRH